MRPDGWEIMLRQVNAMFGHQTACLTQAGGRRFVVMPSEGAGSTLPKRIAAAVHPRPVGRA
jgi:hypothetical protein